MSRTNGPALTLCVAGAVLALFMPPLAHAAASPESVVFFYQNVTPADQAKFVGANAVVTADQTSDSQAIATIHSAGAKAFKYLDFYWYPADRPFEGIDIGRHLDWAFCQSGAAPLVGRNVNGVDWYFLDANERAARNALLAYLQSLKRLGYDGVFVDRGSASLRGPRGALAWQRSTCTADPVHSTHRRFANVYVSVLHSIRRRVGLRIIINYAHPFTGQRLRPDPDDKNCRQGNVSRCRFLSDAWKWIWKVVDESQSADVGAAAFRHEYRLGRAAERHLSRTGSPRVIRAVKTTRRSKSRVYYRWARDRLFRVWMFVNTGDDGCVGATGTCFHFGTYPLLTRVRLGSPRGGHPVRLRCRTGSATACIWIRRYARGMTILNPTRKPKQMRRVRTGLRGCRHVKDVYRSTVATPFSLARGRCLRRVGYALPPLSGRVLVYRRHPW